MKFGLPVVAIVGRPNVGKSSLFNLILKDRKSIVDEMEGVTRDINMEVVTVGNRMYYLYDTAGYLEKGDAFNTLVQEKVKQAIENADLLLFMVDGTQRHPLDEEMARFLSRQGKPIVVVVNKLDNRDLESGIYEFYSLGFDEVLPLSVVHKRGLTGLLERIEDFVFQYEIQDVSPEDEIKVALVGKPNVGKSLLLNALLGEDRSIVSPVAGTTRDSLDDLFQWKGRTIRLIDTAGLRRRGKVEEDIEYYSNVRSIQAIERSDVVIQLIDSSEPMSHQDKVIVGMVQEKGRGLVVAFNKWDLVHPETAEANYEKMNRVRKDYYEQMGAFKHIPVEFISAKEEYKIDRVMDRVGEIFEEYHKRVPTAELNQWLKREIKESQIEKPRSNLKIYYLTQVYTAPPRFVFFVNKKALARKDHPRFMEKRLREAFGFDGVPIKITFRERGDSASGRK